MRISTFHRHRLGDRCLGVVALVLLGAVLVVGCSGSGDDSASGDAGEATAADDATPGDSGAGGAAAEPVAVPAETVEQDANQGRRRTFTATLVLGVEEVEPIVEQASAAVSEVGGFTETENVDLSDDRRASATYRVPADQFDATLDALGALGEVRTQDVSSTDVTAQYTDLESRVATLRTSIERLLGFLGQATDVNQIATIEAELTRREAELESTEGQRRALADQVELSTITVTFESLDGVADGLPGFLDGFDTGRDVAATLIAATTATAGFLVPFLPVLALVVLALALARRRRRRPTPSADPPD